MGAHLAYEFFATCRLNPNSPWVLYIDEGKETREVREYYYNVRTKVRCACCPSGPPSGCLAVIPVLRVSVGLLAVPEGAVRACIALLCEARNSLGADGGRKGCGGRRRAFRRLVAAPALATS